MCDISVIIPVYRVAAYIERCVRSLMEQTLGEGIEFIFVDDSSPDDSIWILKRVIADYPKRLPYVKIITHVKNRGLAAARQTGFDHTVGKYVLHCDSDDWCEPGLCELLLHVAESQHADIVECAYYNHLPSQVTIVDFPHDEETSVFINKSEPLLLYCSVWNKLIRRDLYIDNGIKWFENLNMYEDVGVTTRLRVLSRKTICLHTPLYHYNQENLNAMTRRVSCSDVNQQIQCAVYLEKWFNDRNFLQYTEFLDTIKFFSKISLVIIPDLVDYRRWKTIFPESGRRFWKYQTISRMNKLLLLMVNLNLIYLFKVAIKLKKYLRK